MLDIDTGHHRTGVCTHEDAERVYQLLAGTEGIEPAGLHLYDGQNHQTPLAERTAAVDAVWQSALVLRDRLTAKGWPVPRIVAGGTGSFPIFAAKDDPSLELSPGTTVFHDAGYLAMFPDLSDFVPAALLLTRVISRPGADRLTLDLGNKAVASDPPAGKRLFFPDLPEAREVLHNEEHLVLETARAEQFQPGDELLAIPRHICPTSALHKAAWVIENGEIVDQWPVTARDRWITV
jgi:D-serine deaminase-like pyridoxal phosphate-dependent protein